MFNLNQIFLENNQGKHNQSLPGGKAWDGKKAGRPRRPRKMKEERDAESKADGGKKMVSGDMFHQ